MSLATWTFLQPKICVNQDILHLVYQIVKQNKLFYALSKATEQTLVFTFLISIDSISYS